LLTVLLQIANKLGLLKKKRVAESRSWTRKRRAKKYKKTENRENQNKGKREEK
jgi:hypothetical protein